MTPTFSLLVAFLTQLFMPRHNAQLRLLKAQIQILRTRIPTQRIILSPEEKAELLRIGAECGHEIDGRLEVAKPATYKRWLARMRGGRPFKAVGRPRLTQELRDVVSRIGSENLLWGYKRIAGAIMLETNDEWTVARRYMSLETPARVNDNPNVRLPAVAS